MNYSYTYWRLIFLRILVIWESTRTYGDAKRITLDNTLMFTEPLSLKYPNNACFYIFVFIIFGHIYSTVLNVVSGFSPFQANLTYVNMKTR